MPHTSDERIHKTTSAVNKRRKIKNTNHSFHNQKIEEDKERCKSKRKLDC